MRILDYDFDEKKYYQMFRVMNVILHYPIDYMRFSRHGENIHLLTIEKILDPCADLAYNQYCEYVGYDHILPSPHSWVDADLENFLRMVEVET